VTIRLAHEICDVSQECNKEWRRAAESLGGGPLVGAPLWSSDTSTLDDFSLKEITR
jgi:hypothetical protein